MQIVLKTFEDKAPLQVAHISTDDVSILMDKLSSDSESIYDIVSNVSLLEIKDIQNNEELIAEFLGRYNLLTKFSNKLNKQIQHIISPIMKFKDIEEDVYTVEGSGDFKFTQSIKISEKFDYMNTRDYLENNTYDVNNSEELFLYRQYLESNAGFSISRTALEKTLKTKGYLEDQIEEGIDSFMYKETSYRKSMVLPIVGDYDASTRISFIVSDTSFIGYNGLLQTDPLYLMKLSRELNGLLGDHSYFASKAKKMIEEEDFNGRYIRTINKESNKIKMTGLFQDNEGNDIDVIDYLINHFQLTDDDVKTFVNSRKRNAIMLPETDIDIPTYVKEDIKFDVEYGVEGTL